MSRLQVSIDPGWLHHEPKPEHARLAVQWWGTAGFRVLHRADDGTPHHLWLDPHLSRHSLWEVARGALSPKIDRIEAAVDCADAVAVGHSHFDHAIDAPAIAERHRARIYGSSSMAEIALGYGVDASLVHTLEPGVGVCEGPCTLTAFRSQHSKFAFGRVPAPGHVREPLRWPARAGAFRVGDVLGLHIAGGPASIYHVGSADLIEAELEGVQADVVLACTVGRYATENFTHRLIDALRPKLVIPCHWDQFWRPIEAPVRQIPTNDLGAFLDEVRSHPSRPEVRVLPIGGWTALG
ncbi:MAG: MBL fold metallo-hydrolase [Planctomycetes bacterium]|nr:MBL fold metallo-hydrolase [Deltaproteobacteria bacterium]MCB9875968.1 MBL fold metallo-hydrolase [Planctomycetota bacterium]